METFLTPIIIIPLLLILGFCGVLAPMLLPFFIKDEFKERFVRKTEVWQTPYLYQSKWYKPVGVFLQRCALIVWIPSFLLAICFWLFSELDGF